MRVSSKESESKQTSFYEVHELPVARNSKMKVWDDNFGLDLTGAPSPTLPTVDEPKVLGCCAGFGAGSLGVANAAFCHPWMNGYCLNQIPSYDYVQLLKTTVNPTWDNTECMDPRLNAEYKIHKLVVRGTIHCPFYSAMPLEIPEVAVPQFETVGLETERVLHITIASWNLNLSTGPYAPLSVFDYMKLQFQPGLPYVGIGMAMQSPDSFDEVVVHKHLIFKIDATANVDVNAENIVGVPAAGWFTRGISNFKVIRVPFEFTVPLDLQCSLDTEIDSGNYYHERRNTLWMHAWLEGPMPPNSLDTGANPAGWEYTTPKIYHRARLFYSE